MTQQRVVKHRWTPKEDQQLLDAIAVRGPHNWSAIALQIADRNEKQCRERWVNQLRPDMRKGGWTVHEDSKIIEMYAQVGSSWSEIAKRVPGRTDQAIKNRYNNYLKPKEGRKPLPHAEKLYAQAAASTRATDGGMTCYELSAHYHGDDDALASAACSARDRFKSSAFGHPMVTYAEPVGPSAYPSSSAGRALSHKGALGSAATVSAPQHLPAGHAAGGNKMPTRADRRRDDQLEQDGPTSALRIEQADITLPGEAIDEMVYTSTLLTLVVASEDTSDRDRVINRLIGSLAACVHRAAEDSSAEMQQ